ncbi:MAG: heavy-metal-associated domain-containing protein [Neisseriaceae bacterium]|nr:heavy-metal-associated domain-containing protein [Neisseriaceae bacterium]
MNTITLSVLGMSCQKCVAHVTRALGEVAGVEQVVVSLEGKSATVTTDGSVTEATLAAVVVEEGYETGSV